MFVESDNDKKLKRMVKKMSVLQHANGHQTGQLNERLLTVVRLDE